MTQSFAYPNAVTQGIPIGGIFVVVFSVQIYTIYSLFFVSVRSISLSETSTIRWKTSARFSIVGIHFCARVVLFEFYILMVTDIFLAKTIKPLEWKIELQTKGIYLMWCVQKCHQQPAAIVTSWHGNAFYIAFAAHFAGHRQMSLQNFCNVFFVVSLEQLWKKYSRAVIWVAMPLM